MSGNLCSGPRVKVPLVQTASPKTPLRLVEKEDLLFGDVGLSEYVLDECADSLGNCVFDYPVE